MTYEQAVEYIHSRPRLKKSDNHAAMKKLLEYLDNPQDKLKFVHIAGTNGKGSCAVMCASVLRQAGYKTGLNISPFVIDFTERFSIDGQYIPKQTLADITQKIKFYQEKIEEEFDFPMVEFEIVTAIAFYYFAMEKCHIVCLEVGIGGRLDTTNVIKDCLVSCIMNISYDHMAMLGDTLAQIAYEKAGIIKENRSVVCYPAMDKEALDVIIAQAKEKSAPLILPNISDIKSENVGFFKFRLTYKNLVINQSFTGIHQSYNAVTVINAMWELRKLGYDISDEDIINGIEKATFPARIELIKENPLIILDGGHNIDGVSALVKVLKENNIKNLTAIWASLSDKQPEKIIQLAAPYINTLYVVDLHGARAIPREQLADMARPYISSVYTAENMSVAIKEAMKNLQGGLLVFGSLYLAADAREILLELS
ncbi:MAG: folylpolyglutamate synthase/dihydrofolate synthase family protein [Oscillospiraceae bacterium]